MTPSSNFDMLVLGGGVVGLAFVALAQELVRPSRPLRIGVIERNPPDSARAGDWDLRVSALSPASRRILERCNAWAGLDHERIAAYRRMCVWHHAGAPRGDKSIHFDAAEMGEADLGYILENSAIRNGLWNVLDGQSNVEFVLETPQTLAPQGHGYQIELSGGRRLQANLLVGADGSRSWLREALGVSTRGHNYRQRGIVTHVHTERPHESTAWQCFHPGGPIALLPLADGRSSVVWSCADVQARELLEMSDEDFASALALATGQVLGQVEMTSPRMDFPLASMSARRYSGEGFVLIGDAAHQVHPLAGQGANLGLMDAAALAQCLSEHFATYGAEAGDRRVLRRYERWRRGHNEVTMAMMSLLHGIFDGSGQWLPSLGGDALAVVDRLGPVKGWLAGIAMGRHDDLPESARA